MNMFGLIRKKLRPNTLAAVCPAGDGVAVAQVRREHDMPPILELCSYQPQESDKSATRMLEKIRERYDLERSPCVSMMEVGSYSLLMVEAPDVQPDELRSAIRWKIKDLIDFHIDDAVVDVFEVPDTKGTGRNRMMYVVVARTSLVKDRIDQLLDAGLNLAVVDIPELALRNIAALLPEDVGGVVLVYIGDDKGLIVITRQSTLYLSRRIEKGLNSLPETPIHDGDPDVIRGWMDGIVVEIQRSLDYYESHFDTPQVSSVVITPLSREIDGMVDYISGQLDLPARILDVNSLIDVQEPLDEHLQANCTLAIGAALRKESISL